MDIYVMPSNDWHLYIEPYDHNNTLNMTWVVDEYYNDTMIINITWFNPLEVSPYIDQDMLFIHVKDPQYFFISEEYFESLHPENRTLSVRVPKQMAFIDEHEGAVSATNTVTQSLEVAMVGTALLGPFMIGPLYLLIGMINHL